MCGQSLNHVKLFATPWTVACQVHMFVGFPRQEYWNGLPFPPQGDLSDPGIKPESLHLQHWQWILYHGATWESLQWMIGRD